MKCLILYPYVAKLFYRKMRSAAAGAHTAAKASEIKPWRENARDDRDGGHLRLLLAVRADVAVAEDSRSGRDASPSSRLPPRPKSPVTPRVRW